MSKRQITFVEMSKFAFCFPSGDKMVCQHHNGNWIVFPARIVENTKKKITQPLEQVLDDSLKILKA